MKKGYSTNKTEILIFDDDHEMLNTMDSLLKRYGYTAVLCDTIEKIYSEIDERVKNKHLPYAYLIDALIRDTSGMVTEYFAAKKIFEYIKNKGIEPVNFYINTSHISDEDKSLAKELGVPVINKGNISEYFPNIKDLKNP
jgi:response regulator RpfG family c-di-GMP phosphodiesterase